MALAAARLLQADRVRVRVVSMPSWELFAAQPEGYRDEVLPPTVRVRLGIEAASPFGWERWITDEGAMLAMTGFGASAPGRAPVRGVQVHPRARRRHGAAAARAAARPRPHEEAMMAQRQSPAANPLVRLGELGQSPWYDYITRDLVTTGELGRLDRRGRTPGHDLQSDHLREGDRRAAGCTTPRSGR